MLINVKSTGLETVRKRLGIAPEAVTVVGDGENDVQMFRWAVKAGGVAAVMGSALDQVKAVANLQVADLAGDGVAEALRGIR